MCVQKNPTHFTCSSLWHWRLWDLLYWGGRSSITYLTKKDDGLYSLWQDLIIKLQGWSEINNINSSYTDQLAKVFLSKRNTLCVFPMCFSWWYVAYTVICHIFYVFISVAVQRSWNENWVLFIFSQHRRILNICPKRQVLDLFITFSVTLSGL